MLANNEIPASNAMIDNGKINVSSYLLSPIIVDKENMMDTIIKDGYHSYEEIYANVTEQPRPIIR
jgi:D-xylose transport system substrate-binding protein